MPVCSLRYVSPDWGGGGLPTKVTARGQSVLLSCRITMPVIQDHENTTPLLGTCSAKSIGQKGSLHLKSTTAKCTRNPLKIQHQNRQPGLPAKSHCSVLLSPLTRQGRYMKQVRKVDNAFPQMTRVLLLLCRDTMIKATLIKETFNWGWSTD